LHQVWQPASADVDEDDLPDRSGGRQGSERSVTRLRTDSAAPDGEQSLAATRITLRPHDSGTAEEIEKREVVKGYEYSRGQFLTFTDEELKALDVESSKVVDLEKFVAGSDIDPVYFDSPYYVYPDGPIAVEALRVIGAAMAQAGVVGLGRLTLSRRERMVMVEPRGTGMGLFTLRTRIFGDALRGGKLQVGFGAPPFPRSAHLECLELSSAILITVPAPTGARAIAAGASLIRYHGNLSPEISSAMPQPAATRPVMFRGQRRSDHG
jgi:hypothetical protein